MSSRRTALIAAAAVLACLGGTASTSTAATHVGDDCVANQITSQKTIVGLQSAQSGAVLAVPADGVITHLQIAGIPDFDATIVQNFKLLRPTGGDNGFATAEEDTLLVKGTTGYEYRLPVQAGDRLGLATNGGDLFFCSGQAGAAVGFIDGNLPIGSAAAFKTASDIGVPVSATVEPDVDRDGYGDETQDLCPQSAEVRVACPALGIDAFALQTGGAAEIYVAIYGPGTASVSVAGSLKIPSRLTRGPRPARLTWRATRAAGEGAFTRLRLKFPSRLVAALKRRGGALPLKLTARATNVAGLVSTRKLTLKVR